jgi:hypothetical protein
MAYSPSFCMTHTSAICAILALFFLATSSNLDIKPHNQLMNTTASFQIKLPINDIVVRIEFTVAVDQSVITVWGFRKCQEARANIYGNAHINSTPFGLLAQRAS